MAPYGIVGGVGPVLGRSMLRPNISEGAPGAVVGVPGEGTLGGGQCQGDMHGMQWHGDWAGQVQSNDLTQALLLA